MTDISHINHINLNFLDNLDADALKDKNTGKLRDALITLNGKDYKVTVNNGSVDVNRSHRSLWGSFKGMFYSNKTQTCDAIAERILKDLRHAAMSENTKKTVSAMDKQGVLGNSREIVHYGFSDNRSYGELGVAELERELPGKKFNITTIDDYNACTGIFCDENKATTYIFNAIEMIKSGNYDFFHELANSKDPQHKMDNKALTEMQQKYPIDKLQKWGAFLTKNADRADIIGKLYNYLTMPGNARDLKKTGWAHEFAKNPDKALQKFVMKNLGHGASIVPGDVEKLAGLLKKYVTEIGSKQTTEEKAAALKEFMSKNFPKDIHVVEQDREELGSGSSLHSLFNTVLNTAFFRQTSKIGLDFFRQEKTPVMFQISDFRGKTDASKIKKIPNSGDERFSDARLNIDSMGNLSDKWWKKTSTADFDPNLNCAPITHSEIRHLAKITTEADSQGNDRLRLYLVKGHFQ